MLSREELIVRRHYVKEGLTKAAIAKTLGINRRNVHRYKSNGEDEQVYGPRPPIQSNSLFDIAWQLRSQLKCRLH